jgi:tripartite-type tricarboxylate transporter receptor subunit TctC
MIRREPGNLTRAFLSCHLPLRALFAVTVLIAVAFSSDAWAQDKYPSKPITILVGFDAGSASDAAARLQGDAMSKVLGVPVVVRNVPGAGGRNAVTMLHRAKPDGYTMAMINVPGQIVEQVVRGLPPDVRDFTWVGRQVSQRYFLQASAKSPWKSLSQMKEAKQPISFGATGTGGNMFPISVIAADVVGLPLRFIFGFKAPEIITGIIRGDFEITAMPLFTAWYAAVETGEARPIVIYGPDRHPLWPDLPTGDEMGFPALAEPTLVGQNLYGLPPGTPAAVAAKLEHALQ